MQERRSAANPVGRWQPCAPPDAVTEPPQGPLTSVISPDSPHRLVLRESLRSLQPLLSYLFSGDNSVLSVGFMRVTPGAE